MKNIYTHKTYLISMKRILTILIIAVLLLIVPASAEQVEEWPYGMRNVMPIDVTGVMYDFEEGSNCGTFNNQYPTIAAFMSVPNSQLGMTDYLPSYMTIGGSMCGTQRCYMNIYPYDNQMDWIYVVNGRSGFTPIICCESMECTGGFWQGHCCPAERAAIEFKDDTNYVSFLASTGGDLRVRLYNAKGNGYELIHYETIAITINRTNGEPSNFTQFTYRSAVDIDRMELYGPFNAWNIDDLIVGGGPYYLPDPDPTPKPTPKPTPTEKPTPKPTPDPVDYSEAAEKAKLLIGAEYLKYGLGFDYETGKYSDIDMLFYPGVLEYFNPETKEFEYGTGISDEGLILWAYNQGIDMLGEDLVLWSTAANMMKHDFKVEVSPEDIKPGDVFFLDEDGDGSADTVGMVIEPVEFGLDIIYSSELYGVSYIKHEAVEASPTFLEYRRLPNVLHGGHNPIPKINNK